MFRIEYVTSLTRWDATLSLFFSVLAELDQIGYAQERWKETGNGEKGEGEMEEMLMREKNELDTR